MANIKINEKVLKELFDRFPNIKTAALAARTECAQTAKASDELFKSAIRTSFRLTYLDDTICKCGQSGFFSYIFIFSSWFSFPFGGIFLPGIIVCRLFHLFFRRRQISFL